MRRGFAKFILCITITGLLVLSGFGLAGRMDFGKEAFYTGKALVLLYHDVRPEGAGANDPLTVSAGQFEEHMRMLRDRGFRVIEMDRFVRFMLNGGSLPPNAVVVTFDDGYENFYEAAFPILKRYGMTASNFIVGMSSDLFDPEADPHLTWDQMREMKKHGMGFYSHTYHSHRTVPTDRGDFSQPALTARMYVSKHRQPESESDHRKRVFSDLAFMEKRFREELGDQRSLLAFPYGAYDETVLEEGEKAGIQLFFSTEEGSNTPGSRIVKRINAGEPYMSADSLWSRLEPFF